MPEVKPYNKNASKKEEVTEMFDAIAPTYDFLNHFMSAGIDFWWRKRAIALLTSQQPKHILDIATGTGDLAIAAAKLDPNKIIGIDVAKDMVAIGIDKVQKKQLSDVITLQVGDAENLPMKNNSFDAVMVGFGVRNFGDLEKGLTEMHRVLNIGGMVVILEFSKPSAFPVKQLFSLYSRFVIPTVGRLVSKDKNAYSYLPSSVKAFPEGKDFLAILKKVGYKNPTAKRLTFGVATIYSAKK
jgi:demethylmenaquinone methyltransferase / 2-methoxy-6-polyprenyl-1,4-benzoquinol methylase